MITKMFIMTFSMKEVAFYRNSPFSDARQCRGYTCPLVIAIGVRSASRK